MTTGAQLASITSKKIMSSEDFGARMLSYLRGLATDNMQLRWPQGSFQTALTLSGAVDSISVDGTSQATDGLGHLLDPTLTPFTLTAAFANATGVTYEVGLAWIDEPADVQVNPRTGLPEYTYYVEEIGEEAEPDSVVLAGGGNLTFTVNSVTLSGDDNSGRTVRVFKKTPGPGATTKAVAIQELTVSYSAPNNTITTTDGQLMGQATGSVSLDASDYLVQLVGVSIKSGTTISGTDPGYCFIGTVLGNGPAATPVTFDITGQNVNQASAASEIGIIPVTGPAPISWAISATDVQSAFQEVVDDLGVKGSATLGSALIGVRPADFTTSAIGNPSTDGGGLGTTGDGDEPDSVLDALTNADAAIVASRAFTATLSSGHASVRQTADFVGASSIDQVNALGGGGRFLVHPHGSTDYEFSAQGGLGGSGNFPYVEGASGVLPHIAVPDTAAAEHTLYGSFKRLRFKTNDATFAWALDGGAAGRNTVFMDDCFVESGHSVWRGFSGESFPQRKVVIRNTEFGPGTAAGLFDAALKILGAGTGANMSGAIVFENCLIRGPHSSSTSVGVVDISNFVGNAWIGIGSITFRDCLILHDNDPDINTVRINNCHIPVTFDNCEIRGVAQQTVSIVRLGATAAPHVNFFNTKIYSPHGARAIEGEVVKGRWYGLDVIYGSTTRTSAFTTQQLISVVCQNVSGWTAARLDVRDMKVRIDDSVNPSAQVGALIEFGGSGGTQDTAHRNCHIDGLYIECETNYVLNNSLVTIHGSFQGDACSVRNLNVRLPDNGFTASTVTNGSTRAAAVELLGVATSDVPLYAHGIYITNLEKQNANQSALVGILCRHVHGGNFQIQITGGTNDIGAGVHIDEDAAADGDDVGTMLSQLQFGVAGTGSTEYLDAPCTVEAPCVLRDLSFLGTKDSYTAGGIGAVKCITGAHNVIIDGIHGVGGTSAAFDETTIVDLGAGSGNQLFKLAVDNTQATGRTTAHIIGTGTLQRIGNCWIRSDGSDHAGYINLTGNGSYTHDNMLISNDATTPTVTNSGTGATDADNQTRVSL